MSAVTSPQTVEPALAVPVELPVPALSVSSLQRFWRCPEQWRRHYLLGEREPTNGQMVLGSAVGQAIAHHFSARLQGSAIDKTEARDSYHHAFELAAEGAVFDGAGETARKKAAATLRARGEALLAEYLASPLVAALEREQVIEVEPRYEIRYPGAQWGFLAYLDLLTARNTIVDVKVTGRHKSPQEARRDVQARAYVLTRYLAEPSAPAPRFQFHSLRHGNKPDSLPIPEQPITFSLSDLQAFERRLVVTARNIAECQRTGDWGYASPMGWWCSERCPSWSTCPGGLGAPPPEETAGLPLAA